MDMKWNNAGRPITSYNSYDVNFPLETTGSNDCNIRLRLKCVIARIHMMHVRAERHVFWFYTQGSWIR
jgi:hypothetical protein